MSLYYSLYSKELIGCVQMTIEILCDGCSNCRLIKGKICQAVADLNLKAKISSNHEPKKHALEIDCDGLLRMRVNGVLVSARSDCSVRDLMLIFNKESQMSF